MAFIGAKTLLCLVAALAAGTTTARSVVVERDAAVADGDEYVVVVDSEAKVADGGQYEVETESDIVFGNVTEGRKKRQVDPTWSCTGAFSEDWNIYNVHCETNLEVVGVDCTLDGQDYTSSELDFSVDTSGFVGGEQHVLVITVSARYGFSTGILRYTFRFTRQVTINTVYCRSRISGGNVVITCTGSGITRIKYRVNSGSYQNANSVSEFTVLGSQLVVGTNIISLRITVSGVIRTLTLTAQKIVVAVFNPTCSVSYYSDWNVGCTCAGGGGSEAIQSITYTINGGIQRTASSVSRFQINKNFLQFGQNTIIITFTSASGVVRIATFRVTRTRVFNPSSTYSYDSKGNVLVTCSQSSDSEVIQSITYTINRGIQRTASTVSRFQINKKFLQFGQNTIIITFTSASGVVRTVTFRVTRTRVFNPSSTYSYDSKGNVLVTCSQRSDSEAIQSITYTINNRGSQRTVSSVSRFQIGVNNLLIGQNIIRITFTSVSGVVRIVNLQVARTQGVHF